jgi:hypothetical protein
MLMRERGVIIRHNRLAAFLILLLLLSTFVAVPHYHDDAADHHDCPICLQSNHQTAAGPLSVAFDGIPCLTETTFVASVPVLTDTLFFFSRSTRGPPA